MPNPSLAIQGGIAAVNFTCEDTAFLSKALDIAAEHCYGPEFEKIRLWQMVFQAMTVATGSQLHLPPMNEENCIVFLGSVFQGGELCTR